MDGKWRWGEKTSKMGEVKKIQWTEENTQHINYPIYMRLCIHECAYECIQYF